MTDKYPLLTVKNIKHWYDECDPGWSIYDISAATNAPKTTIHRFMQKNGFRSKTLSEAQENRWKCQAKREKELEKRKSEEHREKLSNGMLEYLNDQDNYNKWNSTFNNPDKIKTGKNQKVILKELINKGALFFDELFSSSSLNHINRSSLVSSLRLLFNRGLINRRKKINVNCNNFNNYNYNYSISNLGRKCLIQLQISH